MGGEVEEEIDTPLITSAALLPLRLCVCVCVRVRVCALETKRTLSFNA